MATSKKPGKNNKPYLQWSKRQSGVVIAYFIIYYIFVAICIVNKPEAAEWLVRLAMYVMIVMVANLGFYNGNSVLEKINGNKLLIKAVEIPADDDDEDEKEEEDEPEYG